jgi:hypothetical protein
MASNFPTSLDNFSNPTSGDKLDSPSHSSQHSDANDAIEALEAKIGIGVSTAGSATVGQVLTAQGGGTAIWATTETEILNTKNALINGSFAVAQRATSFTSGTNNDDAYTLDRWYILSDGNDAIDVTQETSTVPTNGQFAIALDVETTNKKFGIAQIVENKNCLGLIGETVTLSFKAKVSSKTKLDNVKAAIVAWSGTADSVTSDIISAWGVEGTNPTLIANATYENTPANLNVTTSYATYSVTAAIDTASAKNIIVFIWSDVTDTTAGDFLYISQAKLEIGSTATDFDYAGWSFQNELAQCQRYYQLLGDKNVTHTFSGIAFNTDLVFAAGTFLVEMRAVPTITLWHANVSGQIDRIGQTSITGVAGYRPSRQGMLGFEKAGGMVTSNIYAATVQAEIEL